jgi:hypothetical protein
MTATGPSSPGTDRRLQPVADEQERRPVERLPIARVRHARHLGETIYTNALCLDRLLAYKVA